MLVYLIRHGQSENNQRKLFSGWSDTPLTDQGREDAQKAGEILGGIAFDHVFASDLPRAVETARIALPAYTPTFDKRFREVNNGSLANLPHDTYPPNKRRWFSRFGYAKFGGENRKQFTTRVRKALQWFETLDADTVAVFTHEGWLRAALDEMIGTYLPRKHVLCRNCTVAVFEYADGVWKLHSWMNV